MRPGPWSRGTRANRSVPRVRIHLRARRRSVRTEPRPVCPSEGSDMDGDIAFIFPGQGSQKVGMGKALCEAHAEARRVFEEANDALGFDLARLCFDGPESELTLTANTQPAILTCSTAALRVLQAETGLKP